MATEKAKPKKRKQRPSMRPDLCTLEELTYTGASNVRYQKIAELWSFYVTRGPQVGPSDVKPTKQSLSLKDNGWTADAVEKKIEELLFDGGAVFVKQNRDFAVVAREKGFYADSRPTCPRRAKMSPPRWAKMLPPR